MSGNKIKLHCELYNNSKLSSLTAIRVSENYEMIDDRKLATFKFHAELNDFLPPAKRSVEFNHVFSGKPAIKDTIEAIGVPHTEIDLILVNNKSVDFTYHLLQNDNVAVYPKCDTLNVDHVIKLRATPLRESKFVVDVHLAKLARYLRLFGFDTLFEAYFQDDEIIKLGREPRIILTRDIGILKHGNVTHGYWVRNTNPKRQLREVLQRLNLYPKIAPFTRCLDCNSKLSKVAKEIIAEALPSKTLQFYQDFSQCCRCKKIYWQGSHYLKMKKFVAEMCKED